MNLEPVLTEDAPGMWTARIEELGLKALGGTEEEARENLEIIQQSVIKKAMSAKTTSADDFFETISSYVVVVLNHLTILDRDGMEKLIRTRFPCSQEMHASDLIVTLPFNQSSENPTMGFLGIFGAIGGIFQDGPNKGMPRISTNYTLWCPEHGNTPTKMRNEHGLSEGSPCPQVSTKKVTRKNSLCTEKLIERLERFARIEPVRPLAPETIRTNT